jgi:hypothetical protein
MPPQTGLFHLWAEGYKYVAPTALVPFSIGSRQTDRPDGAGNPNQQVSPIFVPAKTDAEAIDITGPAWLSRRQKKKQPALPGQPLVKNDKTGREIFSRQSRLIEKPERPRHEICHE